MQTRYDRARNENRRSFRYHLRLRLAVLEGVRSMYNDYVHEKVEQIIKLRRELRQSNTPVEDELISDSD